MLGINTRVFSLEYLCLKYFYSNILPSSPQIWLSFIYPLFVYWSLSLSFSLLIKLLLSFLGDDVSRFFQPFLTRFNDVLLHFCIFDTTALRTEIQEESSVKMHLLSPHWRSKVATPCIVPEAAHTTGAACVPPRVPSAATCLGDLKEGCLHLWLPHSAGLVLGHLASLLEAWSWSAVPGRQAGVWTHFRCWVPRLVCTWCAATWALLVLQNSGVSWKLNQTCCWGWICKRCSFVQFPSSCPIFVLSVLVHLWCICQRPQNRRGKLGRLWPMPTCLN